MVAVEDNAAVETPFPIGQPVTAAKSFKKRHPIVCDGRFGCHEPLRPCAWAHGNVKICEFAGIDELVGGVEISDRI